MPQPRKAANGKEIRRKLGLKKGKQARVPSSGDRVTTDPPVRDKRESHFSGGGYSTSNPLSDTFLLETGKNNLALDLQPLLPALTLLLSGKETVCKASSSCPCLLMSALHPSISASATLCPQWDCVTTQISKSHVPQWSPTSAGLLGPLGKGTNHSIFFFFFFVTLTQMESPGRRNCLYQTGLWACL